LKRPLRRSFDQFRALAADLLDIVGQFDGSVSRFRRSIGKQHQRRRTNPAFHVGQREFRPNLGNQTEECRNKQA